MSTAPHEADSVTAKPFEKVLLDYPDADIIIRSQDNYHLRVLKTSIVINSPILGELIRKTLDSLSDVNADSSLPVVQLPESGEILHCLLTFIFPLTPLVPPTAEKIMELLSVAQKYQMATALTHIRGGIARQNSLPTHLGPALHIYALAQKYGLRLEALQTARIILKFPMTIEDFDNKLDIMPGPCLYELWKYHERVRDTLASDLTDFRNSHARGTITGLQCVELSSSQIPRWLDQYIESIGKSPNLFDFAELNIAMVRHTNDKINQKNCECASIPSRTIRDFWGALTSTVHGSFEKAESALSLVQHQESPQAQINSTTSPLVPFLVPGANLIIRSSDFVDFRVHKPVLAMASPFFEDLLSLPQPSDSEIVDGLPVVQLSEGSDLLNSLIPMLYPVNTVIPESYEKVLHLLAACQKYDMDSVQSSIRAKVKHGEFPAPKGAEAFSAYAIAAGKGLILEMENAALQTLNLPMTFEILGEGLSLFDGWALRDLANFRKRYRDSLIPCFDPFLLVYPPGPSSIWIGCPEVMPSSPYGSEYGSEDGFDPLPIHPVWLAQLLLSTKIDLKLQKFTDPLDIHSRIRGEYISALRNHGNCHFCLDVHLMDGSTFCTQLEDKLMEARSKELVWPHIRPVPRSPSHAIVLAEL